MLLMVFAQVSYRIEIREQWAGYAHIYLCIGGGCEWKMYKMKWKGNSNKRKKKELAATCEILTKKWTVG